MSDLYIQIKYARIVGQSIERWSIKKDNPFHGNGKCHICGDSAKSSSKKRFHIIQHSDGLFVKCFNCDYSTNLNGYLKTYHTNLYQEMIFEKYKDAATSNAHIITTPKFDDNVLKPVITSPDRLFTLSLPLVSSLPKDHPARLYVASRNIPEYPFLFAENFYAFSSQFNEDLLDENGVLKTKIDEPRLIIPFYDKKGNCFAYQGRDLSGKSGLKYITIRINKKIPNIFGLDRVDFSKPITIVEGPIDSLFLKNCLASVNASLVSTAEKLKSVINSNLITLCFDAEPRNLQICKMYQDAITKGYRIVIWPVGHGEKVDINDLVNLGKDPQKIIDQNTYVGLTAQLMFDRWKKI